MSISRWVLLWIFFLSLCGIIVRQVLAWGGGGSPMTITGFATIPDYATQIAIDSSGNVFQSGYEACCTVGNKGVAKFDSSGNFITKFGPVDSTGVAVDSSGNVYVMDNQQNGVEKFDNNGNPIDITGTDFDNASYNSPYGAAVDSAGNVYVANAANNEILKFNSSLAAAGTITGNGGAFSSPEVVAVDGSDNLYVLDSGNNRLQKFNSNGTFVFQVTGNGGAWNFPEAMTVDSEGNIFVGDSGNNRIQIFNNAGVFQQEITAAMINGSAPTLSYLSGMGMKTQGVLYVGDSTRTLKMTFDVTVPSVSITAISGNTTSDTTPTFTGTTSDSATVLTAIEYKIDNGSYSSCTADDSAVDEQSEAFTCDVNPALATGSHSITVRSTDSKTNQGTANYSFTISAATPTVTTAPTTAPASGNSNPVPGHPDDGDVYQIPGSPGGNENSGPITPTGNSDTGSQQVVVIIEAQTIDFNGYLSAVTESAQDIFNSSANQTSTNIVGTGGEVIGFETPEGNLAWQIGNIEEIWFKTYPPSGSDKPPANILPEQQKKTSVLSLSFQDSDLIPPGDPEHPFQTTSLRMAYSEDGYHWKILSGSVVDPTNKTVSVIQKIGGFYMIAAIKNKTGLGGLFLSPTAGQTYQNNSRGTLIKIGESIKANIPNIKLVARRIDNSFAVIDWLLLLMAFLSLGIFIFYRKELKW